MLAVDDRLLRVKITSDIRRSLKSSQALDERTPTQATHQYDHDIYQDTSRVRVEYAPSLPKDMHAPRPGNADRLQVYAKTLKMWVEPHSPKLAQAIAMAASGKSPEQLLQVLMMFEPRDTHFDLRLVATLYAKCDGLLAGKLFPDETRSIEGVFSTVQVIAYLLTVVEHISPNSRTKALTTWLEKQPVTDANKLLSEITAYTMDLQALGRLHVMSDDEEVSSVLQCTGLNKMVST